MTEEKAVDVVEEEAIAHPPLQVFLEKGALNGMAVTELKELALDAVLSLPEGAGMYQVKEVNARLFEVTHADKEEEIGHRYLVATPSEYEHIRHTMVFDQLCTMDIDLLMEYVFQDMSPEEVKIIVFGILQAPEDTIGDYTKNRMLSMVLNFEAMLRDFIDDEAMSTSGVYTVHMAEESTGNREDGPVDTSVTYIVTEAFITDEDKALVKEATHTKVEVDES